MGSKLISDITTTQSTLTDTDVYELEDAGTSKKTTWAYIKSNIKTYLDDYYSNIPIGASLDYAGTSIPTGWMREDGSSLLRASYPACWANLHSVIGTCTISIASPGVVTSVLHPFITGDCVHFTTTGALPSGLSPSTGYYVIVVDGNTFRLATTYANALAGTAINTEGTQSGTHTLVWSPWNIADSTHFYIPDTRGLLVEGHGAGSSSTINPWSSSTYTGRLGQYKQDHGQQITGTLGGVAISTAYYNKSGVFKDTTVASVAWSSSGGNYIGSVNFDSANSSGSRVNVATTNGPRVGKNRIIRVL